MTCSTCLSVSVWFHSEQWLQSPSMFFQVTDFLTIGADNIPYSRNCRTIIYMPGIRYSEWPRFFFKSQVSLCSQIDEHKARTPWAGIYIEYFESFIFWGAQTWNVEVFPHQFQTVSGSPVVCLLSEWEPPKWITSFLAQYSSRTLLDKR